MEFRNSTTEVPKYGARVLMEFPAEPTGSSTDGVKLTTKTSAVVPGGGSGHSYCEVAAADLARSTVPES
jgi:hypothetical protein